MPRESDRHPPRSRQINLGEKSDKLTFSIDVREPFAEGKSTPKLWSMQSDTSPSTTNLRNVQGRFFMSFHTPCKYVGKDFGKDSDCPGWLRLCHFVIEFNTRYTCDNAFVCLNTPPKRKLSKSTLFFVCVRVRNEPCLYLSTQVPRSDISLCVSNVARSKSPGPMSRCRRLSPIRRERYQQV